MGGRTDVRSDVDHEQIADKDPKTPSGARSISQPDDTETRDYHLDPRSMTAAATEEKIGWIREAAGARLDDVELNTLPVGGPVVITSTPLAEARRRADEIRNRTGVELSAGEILDSPHVFIGSVKDLTRKCVELRERFGISSFLILDLDALAPVVEELSGQ
jgi:hypothetical protein